MSKPESLPVFFAPRAPQGWVRAAVERSIADLRPFSDSKFLDREKLRTNQRTNWFNQTGVAPEMSHFTVIIPIHNEQRGLDSVLNAVMLSDIPSDVRARFILITNNCSDSSGDVVDRFLEKIDKVKEEKLDITYDDPKLDKTIKTANIGNISFSHVNTETAGKSNAFNIGNQIALKARDDIVITLDSDVYLEPDALKKMFRNASEAFYRENTVLLWGEGLGEIRKGRLRHLIGRGKGLRKNINNSKVMGAFMAWRADWVESIGGVPKVVIEDYAMGLRARKEGYGIKQVPDSRAWFYDPDNIKELIERYARFRRGGLQIINQHPEWEQSLREERFEMKKFPDRLREVSGWIRSNPKMLPFHLAYLMLFEYTVKKGQRDYKENPDNETWIPANSTK